MFEQLSNSFERNSSRRAGGSLFLPTLQDENVFRQFDQNQYTVDNLSLFQVHITLEFNPTFPHLFFDFFKVSKGENWKRSKVILRI